MTDPTDPGVGLRVAELEKAIGAILEFEGVPAEHAALVARHLTAAEARGIPSHGVSRLPTYLKRLAAGLISKRPALKLNTGGAVATLDADNAFGYVASAQAMQEAASLAETYGVGACTVSNSTHFGIASLYAEMAAARGCIGFSFTNSAPRMAPWGARDAVVGTNPIAIAVPGNDGALVLDMSTSVSNVGRITLAKGAGESIPTDWALDPAGHPTTDPAQALAGTLKPVAGPKGFGLALMIDVLTGVLSGAAFGQQVGSMFNDWSRPENVGHFFVALHIAHFMPAGEFAARLATLARQVKEARTADDNVRTWLPGELEARAERESLSTGLRLSPLAAASLDEMLGARGIEAPWKAPGPGGSAGKREEV